MYTYSSTSLSLSDGKWILRGAVGMAVRARLGVLILIS